MLFRSVPPLASQPDESGKVTLDLDALKAAAPDDEYELSMESLDALKVMTSSPAPEVDDFNLRVESLQKKMDLVRAAGPLVRQTESYSNMIISTIAEVEDMYSCLQEKMQESSGKKTYETVLENHYSTLKKLMEQKMNKKNSTLSEADVTLKLTGMPDDLDLDSVGVDLVTGDEEEGEEGDDLDLGGDEEEGGEEEGGEEEGGEEEGGDEDELDLGGDDEDSDEDEDESSAMESRRLRDDVIVEIDEIGRAHV